MPTESAKPKGTKPLFRVDAPDSATSAFAVFFSHPSSIILTALVIVFSTLRLLAGDFAAWELLGPIAIIGLWPFLEWAIHVFILHYKPFSIAGRKIDFKLPQTHRDHHKEPWDVPQIFIPLHVYPLTLPLLLVNYLVFPAPILHGVFAFFFLMALNYEWSHYLAHIKWVPPLEYYRRRVREHRWHHFHNENQWWGVSMGLADRIFSTNPDPAEAGRSSTVKDISG
ncbi:MAG: sterol desaturase family protein [Alphaproteobacteria bacterium]